MLRKNRCETCRWFNGYDIGTCHLNPPLPNFKYVEVRDRDFCSKWAPQSSDELLEAMCSKTGPQISS